MPPSHPLPIELFAEIVWRSYNASIPEVDHADTIFVSLPHLKPRWADINANTLSALSRSTRDVFLSVWFRTLCVFNVKDLGKGLDMFQDMGRWWTREIHCIQAREDTHLWDLTPFKQLRSLRYEYRNDSLDMPMNFLPPGHRDFGPEAARPFFPVVPPSSSSSSTSIIKVHISGIEWLDPRVVANIAQVFPDLEELRFTQKRIWCELCNCCIFAGFQEPLPERLVYDYDSEYLGLSRHYARALSKLTKLKSIHFNIACTPYGSSILSQTQNQNKATESPTESSTTDQNQSQNPYLWSGECYDCISQLLEGDEPYKNNWIDKKRELKKEYKFVDLKLIEWRFFRYELLVELEGEEFDGGDSEYSEEENDL